MPRNRMIKSDFWADEKISRLSYLSRLLFIGMWNFSDDIGVIRGSEPYLRSSIFPYDDIQIKDIKECIKEMQEMGLIRCVKYKNESYIYIENFAKHQTINRPSSFRFISNTDKHNILETLDSLSTHDILTDASLTKDKDKDKDKVKEKGKESLRSDSLLDEVVDLWNRNVDKYDMPRVKTMTDARKKKFKKASKIYNSVDDWRKIFNIASTKGFTKPNGEVFTPNWDYIFRNENYIKFHEEYDTKPKIEISDPILDLI